MRKLLLGGIAAFALASPAMASTTPICTTNPDGSVVCDPSVFHVSGPGATGQDPVDIKGSGGAVTDITITNNSGGQSVNSPIDVFFAVPLGKPAPTISNVALIGGGSVSFSSPLTQLLGTFSSGDLYTFVGCGSCNNSEQFTNLTGGLTAAGLPTTTGFTVFETVVQTQLADKQGIDIIGTFANGTYVLPLGVNVELMNNGKTKSTFYDAPFTETGLVDGPTCTEPTGCGTTQHSSVPEPATIALLGFGLLGLGLARRRAN